MACVAQGLDVQNTLFGTETGGGGFVPGRTATKSGLFTKDSVNLAVSDQMQQLLIFCFYHVSMP